jgi:hypothetical protein
MTMCGSGHTLTQPKINNFSTIVTLFCFHISTIASLSAIAKVSCARKNQNFWCKSAREDMLAVSKFTDRL